MPPRTKKRKRTEEEEEEEEQEQEPPPVVVIPPLPKFERGNGTVQPKSGIVAVLQNPDFERMLENKIMTYFE